MASVPVAPTAADVRDLGLAAGLDAVGVAPAEPFLNTRRDLEERKSRGLHGGMQFTYRNPERSTDPRRALPGAQSLIVGARCYGGADVPPSTTAGTVARYARDDHYAVLRRSLDEVAVALGRDGWRTRVVCDDNALVDREAARRAGLGWYGKNSMLLLPDRGSWFVLGSVITDAPIAADADDVADGCGSCARCMDACPTAAIVAPGVVDARRCLAWLVQRAGTFPVEFRTALGGRIYGCDDCQEVCPPNRRADRATASKSTSEDKAWVPLLDLLRASDDELLSRHGRWYIAERDPRWLRRNALVALGNVGDAGDRETVAVLERFACGGDAVLAEHASWALARLGDKVHA